MYTDTYDVREAVRGCRGCWAAVSSGEVHAAWCYDQIPDQSWWPSDPDDEFEIEEPDYG